MTNYDAAAHGQQFIDAWNSQEVERVVACYTEEVYYRDPNTRGAVRGRDAMRRYLTKLFAAWQMHWEIRETYPFADGRGAGVLWRAKLRRAGGEREVEVDGMDLVLMEGEQIARNEVYFDRAVLAELL